MVLGGDCWSHHWIYWLGPLSGGIIGAVCFKVILKDVQQSTPEIKRLTRLASYVVGDDVQDKQCCIGSHSVRLQSIAEVDTPFADSEERTPMNTA